MIGGVYKDYIIITDPVLHSSDRRFGITDLGPTGITTFFSNHKCSPHCAANSWYKPVDNRCYIEPQASTLMWTQLYKGGLHGLPSKHHMEHLVQEFKKFSTTIPWSNKKTNGGTTGSIACRNGIKVDTISFSPPGNRDISKLNQRSTAL